MLTGAMTAAAEMIHVTQPAVSRLVRDLEQELGISLFRRRGNLVTPTAEARALLAEVQRSFIGLGQIRAFAHDLRTGRSGSLKIAALPSMASGFVPRFAAEFRHSRPGLKVSIDGLPSPVIRDRVAAGQFDIGIVAFPFRSGALAVTPLDDKAVVAVPSGHRLAGLRVVRAEDLQGEDLILLSRLGVGQHPIGAALQSIVYREVMETPLSTIACALVSEGVGAAIVDPFSASEFVGRNVVLRPFEPSFNIGVAVVHGSDRVLSVIAQEFLIAFLDHARRFLGRADYLRQ